MNWGIALGVAVVVVILGGVAAILWWNLAHKSAPYADEQEKRPRPKPDNAVVIRDEGRN